MREGSDLERKSGREVAIGALHIGAVALALFLSFAFRNHLPVEKPAANLAGRIVLLAGTFLCAWAFLHIRGGIRGFVRPARDSLVTTGPYSIVRHPVYLGLAMVLIGVAIFLRSGTGLLAVLLLSLPASINRARCEEKKLLDAFGRPWEEYASRTGFLIPGVGKREIR
jgi:protein-S-isoprenylcysteine O-methyltransferase Ste14